MHDVLQVITATDDLKLVTCGLPKVRILIVMLWEGYSCVDHAISTDSEGIQWWGIFRNLKHQGFMKVQLPNGHKYDGVWLNGQLQRALSVRNRRNAEPVYHFH